MSRVTRLLNIDSIFLTSAKQNKGIDALRTFLFKTIEEKELTDTIRSFELFKYMDVFFKKEKSKNNRALISLLDAEDNFNILHENLGSKLPSLIEFETGVRMLHDFGRIYFFENIDEILLKPDVFYFSASEMISAATHDPQGMGRLPIDQAKSGYGSQFNIPENERFSDNKQQIRLLFATIGELVNRKIAQTVSTDGISYLVFPSQFSRVFNDSPSEDMTSLSGTVQGEINTIYSSLVVRLLGLNRFFDQPQLWQNAAIFNVVAEGKKCGLMLEKETDHDNGDITVFFENGVEESTRTSFTSIVHDHVNEHSYEKFTWEKNHELAALDKAPRGNLEVCDLNMIRLNFN